MYLDYSRLTDLNLCFLQLLKYDQLATFHYLTSQNLTSMSRKVLLLILLPIFLSLSKSLWRVLARNVQQRKACIENYLLCHSQSPGQVDFQQRELMKLYLCQSSTSDCRISVLSLPLKPLTLHSWSTTMACLTCACRKHWHCHFSCIRQRASPQNSVNTRLHSSLVTRSH